MMPTADDRALLTGELARRELARRNFGEYLAYTQGAAWVRTRFSSYLSDRVQAFLTADTGNAFDVLLIESPPQHGKSRTITESVPSWFAGWFPRRRGRPANIIIASYNDETAEKFCRRNKDKLRDCGQQLWGVGLGAISRSTEFELSDGTRLLSRGIMAGITGNPADLIVIDDPIKNRQEADSPTTRAKVWEEWQNSLKSRLAAGAKVLVVMTPWHEDDLAARILASESCVSLVRLPVEAEPGDPLGRPVGAALCPELGKGDAWLAQFKASYINDPEGGARAWTALYQCSPRVEGGNMVQRAWWQYYDPRELRQFGSTIISVDAAFKGAESNDFVAITVWSKLGSYYYLRYAQNAHLDFPQTLQAIRTVRRLYPDAGAVVIEDKANGSAIISTLQAEMFCVPVNPKGGKESRVSAVSPAIESGHVLLPRGAPWLEEWLDQWTGFPAVAHDDLVDSGSQAIQYLLRSSGYVPERDPQREEREQQDSESLRAFLSGDNFDPYGAGRSGF